MDQYTGTYYYFGIAFSVRPQDGRLVSAMIGVPEGFEIDLEPAGEHAFRMAGGPLEGSVIRFVVEDDGTVKELDAGGMMFKRVSPEELETLYLVERLEAPPFDLTPEKEAAFEALYRDQLENGSGGVVAYDLPYPKSEFVRFLMQKDLYIFHGTGNPAIEQFEPVRTSVELHDQAGEGNLPAVYGTHDGLWSMFFAVVDRARLDGSIRNGVLHFTNRAGEELPLYSFSINQEQLADRPYRTGWLYMLPRDSFRRLKRFGDVYSNEWASETAVRPAARLEIAPEDFPFLEQIDGHDDGPLVRAQALQRRLFDAASAAQKTGPDSRAMEFAPGEEMKSAITEFIELNREMMPGVAYDYSPGPPEVLNISNMPPAMIQVFDAGVEAREGLEFGN